MGVWGGGREREIGRNRRRTKGANGHGFCAETASVFSEGAVLPKAIGILSSWFLVNPFIVLRMG